MCTSLLQDNSFITTPGNATPRRDGQPVDTNGRPVNAQDLPLGDGMAEAAKLSLLNRRQRIRIAVEGE